MSNKIEIPKEHELKVKWPIKVLGDQGKTEGETKKITTSGIFIGCEKPLILNQLYHIFIYPPNNKAMRFNGKATWSSFYGIDDKDNYVAIGVCFIQISDKDRQVLSDMVSVHHN